MFYRNDFSVFRSDFPTARVKGDPASKLRGPASGGLARGGTRWVRHAARMVPPWGPGTLRHRHQGPGVLSPSARGLMVEGEVGWLRLGNGVPQL